MTSPVSPVSPTSPVSTATLVDAAPGSRIALLRDEGLALFRAGRDLPQVRQALAACNEARCVPPLSSKAVDNALRAALLRAWAADEARGVTRLDTEGVLALITVEYDAPVLHEVGGGSDCASLIVTDWANVRLLGGPGAGRNASVEVEGWRTCGWNAEGEWSIADSDGQDSGLLRAVAEGHVLRIGRPGCMDMDGVINVDAALGGPGGYDLSGVDYDALAEALSDRLEAARAPVPEPDVCVVEDVLDPVEIVVGGEYVEDGDVPLVLAGTWGGHDLVVVGEDVYAGSSRDGVERALRDRLAREFAALAPAVEQAVRDRLAVRRG